MARNNDTIEPFDSEAFEELRDGSWRPTSSFCAVLPDWMPQPSVSALRESSALWGKPFEDLELAEVERSEEDPKDSFFALEAGDYRIVGHEVSCDLEQPGELAGDFSDRDKEAAAGAHYGLTITTVLSEPVLEEFHQAARFLYTIAPDAVALYDHGAHKWRPASWIVDTAASHAPPSPTSLFSIHGVLGDDGRVWLHTHGLLRCGAIEVEVLDVARDAASLVMNLINTAAMMWIERGTPDPYEEFWVGEELPLAWRPWDEAVADAKGLVLGGNEDRAGHDFLVGSLVVPTGKKKGLIKKRTVWASVETHLEAMENHPVFFISAMETQRMSMLSSERFPRFRELVQRFVGEDGWRFAVKLAYQTDPDPGQEEVNRRDEHLWFEVHAIEGARIDATLMNEPHKIERMAAGERDWHSADQLSDWVIYTAEGAFNPDRIGQLLEQVG